MNRRASEMSGLPRVFLIDGSALAYRAHFAFAKEPLSNDRGLNTGAIFGYTKTLKKIMDDEKPEFVAVVFDAKGKTFRHDRYADYKATRQKMPEEMIEQLPYMKEITLALGIPLLEIDGVEADDVIGTLAVDAAKDGAGVDIVTGDKDFMQLVGERIELYNIMKSDADVVIVDPAKVVEKFGVGPDRVIDVLALMGDASDNVPGVPGVGEKTAIDLVRTYGSFDGVFASVDKIKKPKLKASLEANLDIALLSKELVTIKTDVPLDRTWRDLPPQKEDIEKLAVLYRDLGFTSMLAALKPATTKEETVRSSTYRILQTESEIDELARTLAALDRCVVDTETTSLDRRKARLVGISFSYSEGEAVYVPIRAGASLFSESTLVAFDRDVVLNRLRPVLEAEKPEKIGQNIKYDLAVFAFHGVKVRGVAFDTMVASYLLDSGSRQHDLDSLSLKHFDYRKIPTTDLIGTGKSQRTMDEVPIADVGNYACEDADFTWRLYRLFEKELESRGLSPLFRDIEMPLLRVLLGMETTGIRVDKKVLGELEKEISADVAIVEKRIREMAGTEINLASPKQLGTLLFETLKLHETIGLKPQKTKTGWSTNQEVLEAMSELELPRLILEHRSLTKLLSTYVTSLPELIDEETGRIHTTFNQTVAATGRLSSTDPNLQNIPIRSKTGKRIREAFIARSSDHLLMSADYSQIELRIMAHVADDPTMKDAFKRGMDIHRETASRIFQVAPADVDAAMRSKAKSINFGILYGMGRQRLARETGMTQEEAGAFIERYFAMFPTVRAFIDRSKETARETGTVTTLLGRQRAIPDIHSKNGALRSAAENMAVNTPIQGTAADFIKIAMIRVEAWIRNADLSGRMVLQVHDELVFDVPKSEFELFRSEVPKIMSGVYDLSVPLVVDVGSGPNWAAAH